MIEDVYHSFEGHTWYVQWLLNELFSRLPEKQKMILIAIAKEHKAKAVTSTEFIKKYKLSSSSSVQSGLKGLLEKDIVTQEEGTYQVYDKLFALWISRNY